MVKYVIKRILTGLLSLSVIVTISFIAIKLLQPSGFEGNQGLEEAERLRREALGYDKPIMVQFAIYLRNIFTRFDFGTSFKVDYMVDVTKVFGDRFLPTIILNLMCLIVYVPLGILLGIYTALRKGKWQDNIISTFIIIFIALPSFVDAFLLQYFLGYKLKIFPITIASLSQTGNSWFSFQMLISFALPVIAMSLAATASLARRTRGELTEVLTNEHVLLARAKGLPRRVIIIRHTLKNAMVVILPGIIASFIGILSGSIIMESIFGIPGVGSLMITSIRQLDYDLFMFSTLFYAAIGLLAGIVYDLSYSILDPRIRVGAR